MIFNFQDADIENKRLPTVTGSTSTLRLIPKPNEWWLIIACGFEVIADVNVPIRTFGVFYQITRGQTAIWNMRDGHGTSAGETEHHLWSLNYGNVENTMSLSSIASFRLGSLPYIFIDENGQFGIDNTNIQAGDVLQAIQVQIMKIPKRYQKGNRRL